MYSQIRLIIHCLAVFLFITFAAPASLSAQEAAAAPAEDHSAEYKTLELDFIRLDGLFVKYDDPVHKLTILGYINLMKVRAEALKESWDQVKYDELRYDINLQCQRLANWLAPLRTPPPTPYNEGGRHLALSRLNPSPDNPAEVRAALEVVDREINRMEQRLGALTIDSKARDAESSLVQRVKDRRKALGQEFTKAGWDALLGDLK